MDHRANRPADRSRARAAWLLGLAAALGAAGPAWAGEWSLPDSRLGVRTAPLLLLSRPDVRDDLKLDPTLASEAAALTAELHARAAGLRGRATPEILEGRRAIDEAQRQWIEQRLGPDQRARLEQLDLQWEGASALVSRPLVADSLGLTPEQRAAIVAARGDRADPRAFAEHALRLLNDDQRRRWLAMLGPPLAIRPVPGPAPPAAAVRPAEPGRR